MTEEQNKLQQEIDALKSSVEPGSVTPQVVSSILELIRTMAAYSLTLSENDSNPQKTTAFYLRLRSLSDSLGTRIQLPNANGERAGIMTASQALDLNKWSQTLANAGGSAFTPATLSNGKIPDSQLPSNLLRDTSYAATAKTAFYEIYHFAMEDNRPYREMNDDGSFGLSEFYNRYSNAAPDASRPYFAYGRWYTYEEAMHMVFDKWTLGMQGLQLNARANTPQMAKSSDSYVSMAYTCVNNYKPETVALGILGWDSEISPTSLYRAFHSANNLHQIVGVINCEQISEASGMRNAFANTPLLSYFCLKNIPDCITELDLSTCGGYLHKSFPRYISGNNGTSGMEKTHSTLSYLAANFNNPTNSRKKELIVVLSESVYKLAIGSFAPSLMNKDLLIWAYDDVEGSRHYSKTPTQAASAQSSTQAATLMSLRTASASEDSEDTPQEDNVPSIEARVVALEEKMSDSDTE